MLTKIKILIAEHDLHDLEMIETELKRGGIDFVSKVVQSESGYRKALKNFIPEIILSDYRFPSFDGHTAFTIREQVAPHTPFILVSGTIGEENSIELIKNGVTDFVLKDKLFTLVPKVNRALRDLMAWKKKEEVQKQLVLSEAQLAEVQAIAKVGSWVTDLSDLSVKWSRETFRIYGMEEHLGSVSHAEFLEIVHPEDRVYVETAFKNSLATSSVNTVEHRINTSSGELKYVEENWKIIRDDHGIPLQAMGSCQDITERIKGEEQKEFERRDKEALINSTDDIMWSVSNDLKLIAVNNAYIKAIELSTGKIANPGDHVLMPGYFPDSIVQYWTNLYEKALAGNSFKENVYTPGTDSSSEKWNETSFNAIYKDGIVTGCACFSRDITETKKSEASILKAYEEKNTVLESIDDGFFATDKNLLVKYWNSKAEILLSVKKEDILGKNLHETFADSGSKVFYDNYQKAIKENSTIRFEGFSNRTKKWFAVSAFATDNGLSVYFKDVTEQKNDEEKLRESELRYRSLIEQATDTICIVDSSWKFIEINPSGCLMFGCSKEEVLQLSITDVLFEEDLITNPIKIDELKAGKTTSNERRIKRKDGTAVEVELSAKIIEDGRIMVFGRDITARVNLEKALKAEQKRFAGLYLQSPSCMGILKGPDHVFEIANPLYLQLIGRTDIIGKTVKKVLPEMESQGFVEILDNVYESGETFSANEMLVKFDFKGNGELVDTYLNFMYQAHRDNQNNIDGILFFAIDVTEQVMSRRKIEESEERYRQIVETAQEGIWLIDENHKTTFVNNKMCEILEYTEAEMMGKDIFYFMDDEAKELAAKLMEQKKEGQSDQKHFKYISKSGNEIWTNLSANPLFDNNGNYKGSLAMVTDITKNKKAEKRDQFQATLLNTIGQAAIATDMQGKINFWNKAASAIYGWTEEEVLGKNIMDITPARQTKKQGEQIMHELSLGNTWSGEFIVGRKDGSEFPAFVTNTPIYDQQQQLIGIIGVSSDITSRKQAEQRLQESNERYNLISKATNDMVWDWDLVTGKIYRNKEGWKKIFRTGDNEIENDSTDDWNSRVHPDDKEKIKIVTEAIKNSAKDYFEIECRVMRNDGTYAYTQDRGNIFRNDQGIAVRSIGATQDITKRKRAEQEMTWLINNTEESFILLDRNLNIISYNNQFQQLHLKYMESNVEKGNCILDYAQPERRQLVKEIYERVLQGADEEYEMNIPLPDKSVKIFALKYKPAKDEDGKIIGVFVSAIDVTEKRISEQQLIIQEKRYRALVDNGEDGVVILSPEGKLQYTSPTTEKILGYTEEELWKLNMFSLIHPDDLAEATKVWEQVMNNSGKALPDNTIRMLHKNGSWRWLEATLTNMLHDPALNGIVDNFRDVTERIEGEQLREFERIDKEALINTTSDFIWSVSSDFRLIAANASFINYMKNFDPRILMPGDELLSKETFSDEYLAIWKELYKSALRGESLVKEMHSPSEEKHLEQWFETTLHPIYNNNKITGIACYSKDITERKQSEIHLIKLNEDLQKQAKELVLSNTELEQFAYVASHDLQEPLRMITSFLSRLEKKYGTVLDEKGKQYIHFAVDGAKRMRQIILDLLDFSRVGRTEEKQEVIDLNKLVDDIKILFRKQIEEKKAVIISGNLPHIPGYKSPLRQVFQNLISNALKFGSQDDSSQININCIEFNDHWQFAVRDNGIGIEQEYFDKIFIIFQRLHNKDEYSGTGMGLAITKKIIENQGGKIWVESAEGKGSTFYFTIQKK